MTVETKESHKDSITTLSTYNLGSVDDVSEFMFFSGSEDKQVRMWDLRSGGAVKMFTDPSMTEEMGSICHASVSQRLYVCNQDQVIL